MNKKVVNIIQVESFRTCATVPFFEKEKVQVMCDQDPDANIEFSLVNKQGSFNVFLQDEVVILDFIELGLLGLLLCGWGLLAIIIVVSFIFVIINVLMKFFITIITVTAAVGRLFSGITANSSTTCTVVLLLLIVIVISRLFRVTWIGVVIRPKLVLVNAFALLKQVLF